MPATTRALVALATNSLVVAALLTATTAPAAAVVPGDNGQIAFVSYRNGYGDVL